MKTKLFMMLAIVLMGVCSSMHAQSGNGRRVQEFPSKQMIQELKLTDEQVANLKKGNEELRAQMEAARQNKDVSREERRATMEKMRAARNEMVKKNLTEEQYKAYLELEKKNANNRRQMNGDPQGPRPDGQGFGPGNGGGSGPDGE